MSKTPVKPTGREINRARTKTAVQEAVSEVKGAVGIQEDSGKGAHNRPRKEGLTWLLSLGAGAVAAWKSWNTEQKQVSDAHENTTTKRIDIVRSDAEHAPRPFEDPAREEAEVPESDSKAENKVDNSLLSIGKEFYKRFNEDEITTRAAALAFVGVFSLVPILLFAVIALGFIFRDPTTANRHVQQFVSQLLPGESASKAANDVLAQTHLVETAQGMTSHLGWPLIIGVASLLWAGISLFVTSSVPMNTAWDVTETRSFLKLRLVAFGIFCGAGLVFLLSLGVSAMPRVVANLTPPLFGTPGEVPLWAGFLFTLLAIGLDALMFILIYKFLPNVKVTWKAAVFSGVTTGLLWEAFKQGFAYYLAHFGNSNNKLYGALGGVVLLITWIYYSCIILLSGAEVGKMYHERREEGGIAERTPRQTNA